MFILAMVIMGVVGYTNLQVSRFPNINFPVVAVVIGFPGASAQEVEQLVTDPVERALNGVSGVKNIVSTSREGSSIITVNLNDDVDVNRTAIDIDRTLSSIRGGLPADSLAPTIIKADTAAFPIMNVALAGDKTPAQLYDFAKNTIQPRLQTVPGVATVRIVGGQESEVHVLVDPVKLQAYGLTMQQVQGALASDNLSSPGGTVRQRLTQFNLRTSSSFKTIKEFEQVVVSTTTGGVVKVGDFARVEDTHATESTILRFNGKPSLGLTILQQSDANAVATADGVRKELARLGSSLPAGVTYTITADTTEYTKNSIQAVQRDLVLAVLACGLTLLLFLHTWRNTVIVLLAIPTSMITTFLGMFFLNFTLDVISLMALALLVGILVDDSIVVLENIHRHRKMGEEPILAALNGRMEIGAAALAITLTDVVVFAPMAFLSGVTGAFFKEYGLVIVSATLLSLFISFTLTPMMAAHWLKPENVDKLNTRVRHGMMAPFARFGPWFDARLERLQEWYRGALHWSLRHRVITLAAAAMTLVFTVALLPLGVIGFEVAPTADDGLFTLDVQMSPGSSLAATSNAMGTLENRLLQMPAVKYLFSTVGSGGGGLIGVGGSATGNVSVQLVDKGERKQSVLEVLAGVREWSNTLVPGMEVTGSAATGFGPPGAAISIRVLGDDFNTLTRIANELAAAMRTVPNTTDVKLAQQAPAPEVQVEVNRTQAANLGVTPAAIAGALRTAVNGAKVGRFDRGNSTQSSIVLLLDGADQMSVGQLGALPVFSPVTGGAVRLDQVATLNRAIGPSQIDRADLQRQVSVEANITGGTVGVIETGIQLAARDIVLPPGYRIDYTSAAANNEVFIQLFLAFGLSILLMYMLLVGLYQSFTQPLAIMLSLPLAIVGALLGLMVSGNSFSIFAMLGMILLMALVAKNGILLIDYTNTLRQRGMSRADAIAEAGATRLRPILMTSATIVFAMIPLSLKLEAGGETRAPIAVVLMGGVISSTIMTLLVTPVGYTVLEDWANWSKRAARRVLSFGRRPSPQPTPESREVVGKR